MASWKVWGCMLGRCDPRQLGQATCPWLRWFSCPWWWLSHPTYLYLQRLSNRPHRLHLNSCLWLLLWHISHPYPLLSCLWPLLWPLNPSLTFLWHPSCPLPILLLQLLSHPSYLCGHCCSLPYLVTHLGKLPAWLCLPATGTQIVVTHRWLGEW